MGEENCGSAAALRRRGGGYKFNGTSILQILQLRLFARVKGCKDLTVAEKWDPATLLTILLLRTENATVCKTKKKRERENEVCDQARCSSRTIVNCRADKNDEAFVKWFRC